MHATPSPHYGAFETADNCCWCPGFARCLLSFDHYAPLDTFSPAAWQAGFHREVRRNEDAGTGSPARRSRASVAGTVRLESARNNRTVPASTQEAARFSGTGQQAATVLVPVVHRAIEGDDLAAGRPRGVVKAEHEPLSLRPRRQADEGGFR